MYLEQERISKLIRQAVDGELSGDQQYLLERLLEEHPQHLDALRFEEQLRVAVTRHFTDGSAVPFELAERIRAQIADSSSIDRPAIDVLARIDHETTPEWPMVDQSTVTARIRKQGRRPRRRLIPSGLAAGLFIIGSLSIIIGLMASDPRNPIMGGPGTEELVDFDLLHDADTWQELRLVDQAPEAEAYMQDAAGRYIGVPDLTQVGYDFDGLADLQTLGGDPQHKFHLRYRGLVGALGLTIAQASNEPRWEPLLTPDTPYRLADKQRASRWCYLWMTSDLNDDLTDDRLIYWLAPDKGEATQDVARAAGMPAGQILEFGGR